MDDEQNYEELEEEKLKKARTRKKDKKKMRVSGKGVFTIQKSMKKK